MRVSIVVTNFNYERYVGEAIESALSQTHDDVEVVVVDDGSVDGSRAVIDGFGDSVVGVFKDNGGQGSAVNAGFAACSGDAVIFLDADDLLRDGAAADAAELLAEPGVVKVHWPLDVVDSAGTPLGYRVPGGELPQGDLRPRLLTCPDYLTPAQSGNAFARTFLEAILPMPEEPFVTGADTYLFLLAPAFGEIRAISEPRGRYRRHTDNNYAGQPFDERTARLRGWFDATLEALEHHCAERGVPADPSAWRRNAWVYRVTAAARELDAVIPQGTPFVLVDGGEWAMGRDERRTPIPFVERDGTWWGPPADDAEAIAELERLRAAGARYLVVGFPAFWWLDHYRDFAAHVATSTAPVTATGDVLVYDLAGAS